MMSEKIDLLATALCELQGELQSVEKNAENPFFKSGYADLSGIWNAVRPLLHKHGFSITQTGTRMYVAHGVINNYPETQLLTTLFHKSGQWVSGITPLLSKDNSMQQLGSAWTYARRYGLCAILGVSQADDDGHEATQGSKKVPVKVQANPQATFSPQAAPESPGEWIIPFGTKHKGKKMSELSVMEYESFAKYLEDSSAKDGKPLSKNAADFIEMGQKWFGGAQEDVAF